MTEQEKREKVTECLEDTIHNAEWANKLYTACDVGFLKDVLALLKAQEPRVMTLNEIRDSIKQDKRISVYLQTKNGACREPHPALYTNFYVNYSNDIDLRYGVDYVDLGGQLEQNVLYAADYLKTWCLWTAHPTDEQREAVKWE